MKQQQWNKQPINRKILKNISGVAVGIMLGIFSSSVCATESGADSFPHGAEGIMAGALPPAGLYFLGYYQQYRATEFLDSNGDELIPDFDLDVHAFVPRMVWMTDQKILNGQLGFYGILPLVDLRVQMAGERDHRSGLGDMMLAPMLGWHNGSHHWIAALENILPTGDYDADRLANIGKNYYTFRPIFAYSYNHAGWDISTKMAYSFNTENNDTDYQSGQYFSADYSLGYQVFPYVSIAVQGYVFKRMSDDKKDGVDIGFRGQSIAIGPAIQYQQKGWSLEAKYLTETKVENRPKGDAAWLKLVWSFN